MTQSAAVGASAYSREQRSLLTWFSTGHLANDWAPAALWLLAPAVALSMGLTPAEVGLLISIHSVGAALAYFPAGLLADRVRNRGGMLAATFWWVGIGYFAASFADGFWTLALMLAIAGMGDAAWHPIATGVLTQANPKRRAHVLGLHAVGGTLAEVLAPLSVGFLLAWFEWQQVLQLSAIPAIIAGIAFLFIRHRVPPSETKAISLGDLGQLRRAWCTPTGGALIVMLSFYNMALIGILSMTPLYLQGRHGFATATTGLIFSGMILFGALAQPYLGLASDLIGRRSVFLVGNLVAAAAALLIYLSSNVIVVIVLLVIVASTLTGIRSAALASAVDFAKQREATTLGLAFALLDGVGALGGAAAGLAAWYDLSYAFLVAACFSCAAALLTAAMPAADPVAAPDS